jgi:hypothetical protein
MRPGLAILFLTGFLLAGCSKPEDSAKAPEPDNAVTRYGQNLAGSEQRAQEAANKANAAIARQQEQMNEVSEKGQ